MNRRSAPAVTHLSFRALLFTVVALLAMSGLTPGQASATPAPPDDVPVVTANPFLPEEEDLTTCVGMLQRPGCGSSERGGWHQNLVAIAMIGGLVIVFGRVAWGVRRNRHHAAAPGSGDLT